MHPSPDTGLLEGAGPAHVHRHAARDVEEAPLPTGTSRGTTALFDALAATGFYPQVATSQIGTLVGPAPVRAHVVMPGMRVDSTSGLSMELQALALTDDAVVCWGAYEAPGEGQDAPAQLRTHGRVVPLAQVSDVRLITAVTDPASFTEGDLPDSARVVLVLSGLDRLELEPAGCDEPDCEGEHALGGELLHDAIVISETLETAGAAGVAQLLHFGEQAAAAVAHRAQPSPLRTPRLRSRWRGWKPSSLTPTPRRRPGRLR